MNLRRHRPRSRADTAAFVFAAIALAGCGGAGGADTRISSRDLDSYQFVDAPFDESARDVFEEGFDLIADRYIDPVDLGNLATDGLTGLTVIDPSLSVERAGEAVRVLHEDAVIHDFSIAESDDPDDLSANMFDAIVAMRSVSPDLGERKSEAIYAAFFDGMIGSLDAYTRYAGLERARENRAQREGYGGIGIRIRMEDDVLEITDVMERTPADRAGLEDRDAITHVDGTTIQGLTLPEAVSRLRGPIGTEVRLTIRRGDEPEFGVDVERAHIVPQTVEYERYGDIAYMRITRFNQRTSISLREKIALMRSEAPRPVGLVLDLRDNPGGLLDQAVEVSDIFLADGLILTTHGRHQDSHQRFEAGGVDYTGGLPMAVLINSQSASAAEIVAAAMQDNGRAVLIGTTSFGKGTVQTVFRLPNSAELTLTWSRLFAPSGYVLHGLGILPTVCTADQSDEPGSLLAVAHDRGGVTQATLVDWRSSDTVDDPLRTELRQVCPPGPVPDEDDFELQAALLLLGNPVSFQDALMVSASQVAGR